MIADIQRFSINDGSGIRTTVFFKGCPLKCAWCHNPETQSAKKELLFYKNKCINCGECQVCPNNAHIFTNEHLYIRESCTQCGACVQACPTLALELCGREYTVSGIVAMVKKDMAFYGESGGITLSGGEPLIQEMAVPLLKACKENGINTAVETCGYVDEAKIQEAQKYVDTFLWDIKDTNEERHKRYTGVSNKKIIKNLFLLDKLKAKTVLRCILVSGVNDEKAHYDGIIKIFHQLKNCVGVEILPYHSYGGAKSLALGKENSAVEKWIPTKDRIFEAREYLMNNGVTVL